MAESAAHMEFVRGIVNYISKWPDCVPEMIEVDLPEFSGRTTQALNKFYPDVYYRDFDKIIIGEAKTDNDIDNSHTHSQLDAYIAHTGIFCLERHIILSGSFYAFSELKNIVIRKKRKEHLMDVTFHILSPLHKPAVI